ncbi:conjugal transfer protein [Clostridioides sp. GD02377]|uniref:conjugal transfer protein n=1 Tax=unclassified Clostridioides TaxID=2635829 RepID=UPI0038B10046
MQNYYERKYYALEETAPAGYVLNQNKIPFELKYAGQTVDTAVQSTTVKEVVITGGFDLVKFGNYDWQTTLASILNPKEIIEKQVVDTNSIESFVESFSKEYFSWQQSQDSQDKRIECLKNYLTENLQQLNTEMVRSDIPTSSIVNSFQVWSVTQNNENAYDVLFSVGQQISEGENKKNIASTYTVTVYVDEVGNMVIIKNPTIDSKPQKASYEPVLSDSDGTVDANTTEEINSFLDTFFKLYPTATEKELSYYVSNQAFDVINKDYVFVELVNPVYTQVNNQVTAIVTVKYLDKETKVTQLSQFELTLQKNDNWKIIME